MEETSSTQKISEEVQQTVEVFKEKKTRAARGSKRAREDNQPSLVDSESMQLLWETYSEQFSSQLDFHKYLKIVELTHHVEKCRLAAKHLLVILTSTGTESCPASLIQVIKCVSTPSRAMTPPV